MSLTKPVLGLSHSPVLAAPDAAALADWIRANRIDEIECVTPDLAGIARGKVMPAAKFVQGGDVRLPVSILISTINGEYAAVARRDFDTDSDLTLRPDFSTARAVPWASDPSLVIIHDLVDGEGRPSGAAPRTVLRRVVDRFAEAGLKPVVAPEIEFYLTKKNTDPDYPLEPPVGRSGRQSTGSQAFSLSAVDEYERVIEHIYDYADAQGLEIDTIIQESGAAQLEINLVHGDPMELADQVFLFKRLIREAAMQCGCYATFMAKPMENQPGSAMHVHMSVVETATGRNIFSDAQGRPTPAFSHFIGGQQRHFPAAMAMAAPYVNSYRRLVAYQSAPINLEWGIDNRSVGIRTPKSTPEARRVENRIIGSDANPYLAIAGALACGWLGMEEKAKPRAEATGDAYLMNRDLPESQLDSVIELESDAALAEVLGPEFVKIYCAVKRAEHAEFMRVISPWEREYLLLNV
ncbi:glutamine synthetase [Pikeienuella piscinae]|uniref:Glutamine synthetase n=1 Tax=Pikeienuella piscinae TaxID=2748098 RepID=A0A7M3T6D0_9RHOB|nr:glutamine synthetase family protein [Pikeienuella piscinae]QIE57561.1 glutamine synthetase [Pikeienuella piscinae]